MNPEPDFLFRFAQFMAIFTLMALALTVLCAVARLREKWELYRRPRHQASYPSPDLPDQRNRLQIGEWYRKRGEDWGCPDTRTAAEQAAWRDLELRLKHERDRLDHERLVDEHDRLGRDAKILFFKRHAS